MGFILAALLAAVTTVFTIPTKAYSGTVPVPVTSVPVGTTAAGVFLDISQMTDPATSFDCEFDLSYDGGTNWGHWMGATRPGGPVPLDRNGNPINTASFSGPLPATATAQTQIRGTCTIVGTITTGGTVMVAQ